MRLDGGDRQGIAVGRGCFDELAPRNGAIDALLPYDRAELVLKSRGEKLPT
jgi:hypothetical protein